MERLYAAVFNQPEVVDTLPQQMPVVRDDQQRTAILLHAWVYISVSHLFRNSARPI